VNSEQEALNRKVDTERLIDAAREVSECHSCLSDGHGDERLKTLKLALAIYERGRCSEVATRGPFGEEWCYPCHLERGHEGWHRHETASGSLLVTWEA